MRAKQVLRFLFCLCVLSPLAGCVVYEPVPVQQQGPSRFDRAWDAAVAGWVRAALGAEAADLRADLDRVAMEVLIPERARMRPVREQADGAAAMRAEWEKMKMEWK